MANMEVRELIKKSRLFQYEIADALGISESAFSKWLRSEMGPERKQEVLKAIETLRGACLE